MHASTKWLIAELVVIGSVVALLGIAGYPLFFPYQWHKLLHIIGAVIFWGNIVVTALWMAMAEHNGNPLTLHFASKVVNWADVCFTAPGVLLLLANGMILAANAWGGLWHTSWVAVALGLFILSGLVWVVFLLRYQNQIVQLSANLLPGQRPPEAFFHALHRWYFWGILATLLPLASLILMVIKPRLW